MSNDQDGGSRHRDVACAVTLAAPLLGLGVFLLLQWRATPLRLGKPELAIWKLLIIAQVVGWGMLVGVGIRSLGDIEGLVEERGVGSLSAWQARHRTETASFLALIYVVIGLFLVLGGVAGMRNPQIMYGQTWKIALLHILGGVGAAPLFVAMKRIQLSAIDDRLWSATRRDIEHMRVLRRHLRTVTAALGMTVAFAVISSGALRAAVDAAGRGALPASFIVIYGAWFTGVLAAVYLHAFTALERRGHSIMEKAAPLPDPDPASAEVFAKTAGLRSVLSQELELGGDPRKNLEGLIAVLSPLIGGLLSLAGLGT